MYKSNLSSIYQKAPDLLLDKLADVNATLLKAKPDTASYKFWKSVADVMKFAYGYMVDYGWIIKENEVLQAENEFLKSWTAELTNRLIAYEAIKAEKMAGTFEEAVNKVDEYLKNEGRV